MQLLTCSEDCTLVEFAQRHQIRPRDVWLPLPAAQPSRSSSTNAPISVAPRTALALLDNTTDTLTVDKRAICVKMHVADALACDSATVLLDPAQTPPNCTVFIRWDRPGTKHLKARAEVLHYAAGDTLCTASKRSRTEEVVSVDASTLATTVRSKQHRLSLAQRSVEDMQQRLTAALRSGGVTLQQQSVHILQSTLSKIRHRSAQSPLHFVVPSDSPQFEAGGVSWARPNRRLLSRVFRGTSSAERSEGVKYADGSRQVRFYFIEDVLLCRTHLWKQAVAVVDSGDHVERAHLNAVSPSPPQLALIGGVLADMERHAERGYRIILIDHYPALHHGSRHTVETTLAPVVRLCQECCPHLTVSVLLSVMSNVTAARRQGMELSFVLPQVGLLQFFITEMNTSLQPDLKTAAVVGSCTRGSPFLNSLHRDFAMHAGLTYVDVAELRRSEEDAQRS